MDTKQAVICWGMDVSTRRLALAAVWENEFKVHTLNAVGNLTGAERLAELYESTRFWVGVTAAAYPPTIVFVEQPVGRFLSPPLLHAVGVTMGATYAALAALYAFPVSVIPVGVTEWKKAAIGNHLASKSQIMAWAQSYGYTGSSQDEADALGIAVGGRALMGLPATPPAVPH